MTKLLYLFHTSYRDGWLWYTFWVSAQSYSWDTTVTPKQPIFRFFKFWKRKAYFWLFGLFYNKKCKALKDCQGVVGDFMLWDFSKISTNSWLIAIFDISRFRPKRPSSNEKYADFFTSKWSTDSQNSFGVFNFLGSDLFWILIFCHFRYIQKV